MKFSKIRRIEPQVNWQSPQAQGLLFALPHFPHNSPIAMDLARRWAGVRQNGLPLIADAFGVGNLVPEFTASSSHYINFSGLHFSAGVTISAWISVDNPTNNSKIICGEWDNPSNIWLLYVWNFSGSNYRIAHNSGTDRYFTFSPSDRWAHVVFDTTTGQGYLNGVAQTMSGTQSSWSSTASDFQIGKWASNYMNGRLADLRRSARARGIARN